MQFETVGDSVRVSSLSNCLRTLLGAIHVTIVFDRAIRRRDSLHICSQGDHGFRRNFRHTSVENRRLVSRAKIGTKIYDFGSEIRDFIPNCSEDSKLDLKIVMMSVKMKPTPKITNKMHTVVFFFARPKRASKQRKTWARAHGTMEFTLLCGFGDKSYRGVVLYKNKEIDRFALF